MEQTMDKTVEKTYDIPLHDIKPLVEIQEYSMELLIALNIGLILVIMGVIYLLLRWLRNRKKMSTRKLHKRYLAELSLSDTKNAAYRLTEYGATFKGDTPRHTKAYEELCDALEPYKYKKEVAAFSTETLHFIELYRGMIDE